MVTSQQITWGEDLPYWVTGLVALILLAYVVRAFSHWRQHSPRRALSVVSDLLAGTLIAAALLRPVWINSQSTSLGARIAVLVDGSRRMQLKLGAVSRAEIASDSVKAIRDHFRDARLSFFEFGNGPLRKLGANEGDARAGSAFGRVNDSDLTGALEQLEEMLGERPAAVIVISDGRLSRPASDASEAALVLPKALRGTVLHTVDAGVRVPADATLLHIETSGNAVAHQPFSIAVEVGCFGGLVCSHVPVVVREHKRGVAPTVLATGEVDFHGEETARISLELTIERAGSRVIEVAIVAPNGDEVPQNNSRMLAFQVLRDRLRLLHVAGRPTYDVRALRNWLKSDASVDLVSFFILRTDFDDTNANEDTDLALIPFPVDELFDEHLPSFDAVLLGDIDAERYRLSRYLGNLARYVEGGGGLILIGGPSAFAGGAYASSPLERVLPVTLVNTERPFDTVEFVPRYTNAGKSAAMLAPLRALLGEGLSSMPGANTLGVARNRAVVLWEHPNRRALPIKTGGVAGAMPVLAVSEIGDGRVVALGVDGTHRMAFSEEATKSAGRAFGALWDGLLGWAIRDPRFESIHGEIVGDCIAMQPSVARIGLANQARGELVLEVASLDVTSEPQQVRRMTLEAQRSADIELGPLPTGAYSASVRLNEEPATRFDFACELGGAAWSDTRPDPARLSRLAKSNGGKKVGPGEIGKLPKAGRTTIHGSRQSRPILSVWLWAFLAACALGCSWLLRRAQGYA